MRFALDAAAIAKHHLVAFLIKADAVRAEHLMAAGADYVRGVAALLRCMLVGDSRTGTDNQRVHSFSPSMPLQAYDNPSPPLCKALVISCLDNSAGAAIIRADRYENRFERRRTIAPKAPLACPRCGANHNNFTIDEDGDLVCLICGRVAVLGALSQSRHYEYKLPNEEPDDHAQTSVY